MFQLITADQVTATHKLYWLLRKLKIIGLVETVTQQIRLSEYGRPIRYNLQLIKYHADMKGKFTPEEALTMLTMWGEEFSTDGTSS